MTWFYIATAILAWLMTGVPQPIAAVPLPALLRRRQ